MSDQENLSSGIQSEKPTEKAPVQQEDALAQYPWSYAVLNFLARSAIAALAAIATLWFLYKMKAPTLVIFIGGFGLFFLLSGFLASHFHWPYPKEAMPELVKRQNSERPQESPAREVVETIVFVVVLVLLLKAFAAEAFVIPTGSMAETLFGNQKEIECVDCGYTFYVNASREAEGKGPVDSCQCPNCRRRYQLERDLIDEQSVAGPFAERTIKDPGYQSGDRVLVVKYLYDLTQPRRLDVVVFKFPVQPQKDYEPMNYIKRLIGLPGESLAITNGDVYALSASKSPKFPPSTEPLEPIPGLNGQPELRRAEAHLNLKKDLEARMFFQKHPFQIIRKPPKIMLAMRRIVYDANHPAKDLTEPKWDRWVGEAWKKGDDHSFSCTAAGEKWLRYRHVLRTSEDAKPTLIGDFMGYNTNPSPSPSPPQNWVGDLMVECDVDVKQASGQVILELRRSDDIFQAVWDLSSGVCRLLRNGKEIAKKETDFKDGNHSIRLANFDHRLTVWVDGDLPFGPGVEYKAGKNKLPTKNDLMPVSVGLKDSSAVVSNLRVWRDTYYTVGGEEHGGPNTSTDTSLSREQWRDPEAWSPTKRFPVKTLYVQPDHFFCMGDNSPESADGRSWGLVPRRLMLGRALMVYWPFNRAGRIR